MVTLKEGIASSIRSGFCTLSQPLEKTIQLGEDLYNNANIPGAPSGPTPLGQALRTARNLFCNEPPDDAAPGFEPGLPNGQCPGTVYTFDSRVGTGAAVTKTETDDGDLIEGPIGNVEEISDDAGLFDYQVTVGNGVVTLGTNFTESTDFNILNIQPVGGPDDCGGTPETPREPYNPDDFTETPDVTYDDGNGNEFTIPVGLVYAPVTVEIDGTVTVPVKVKFDNDFEIDASLNLDEGDVNFNVNVGDTNIVVGDDETVIEDPDGGDGIPPSPITEVEKSIIGVAVFVTNISSAYEGTRLLSAGSGAEFYVPRLASVSFLCEVLSGPGLAWTVDLDVKFTNQVVYCPVPWGAKAVAVTEQDGIEVETTLIRAASERDLMLLAAGR